MEISLSDWMKYKNKLSAISTKASDELVAWLQTKGGYQSVDKKELISYAYSLATKYGEATASLSAQMYDEVAEASGATVPSAEVANTVSYSEMTKAINGVTKTQTTNKNIGNVVSRYTKRAAEDTTLNNAERDGAQFAWVPMGDTCVFCLTLASRGWQYMSKSARKNGHASHIHANCDCTYAVRFSEDDDVEGYDPKVYQNMYYSAEGSTPSEKINSMRRIQYQANKDKINAQKRANYAEKNNLDKSANSDNISKINTQSDEGYSAKGDTEYPYSYETNVKPEILKVFNNEVEKAQSRFGNITTISNLFVLTANNNDEGVYFNNGRKIGLRHAEKKDGLQIMANIAKKKYKKKDWSTSDPHHVMRHEIGHAIQYEHRLNDAKWDEKLERINKIFDDATNGVNNREFPSKYASQDPNEFISECIAASYKKKSSSTVNDVISILTEE